MEPVKKKSFIAKLFAVVFGIMCLLFTGAAGYLFTSELTSPFIMMNTVILIFVMWMSYVGVFVDLSM
jgi:thiol:disulfide interchange protein